MTDVAELAAGNGTDVVEHQGVDLAAHEDGPELPEWAADAPPWAVDLWASLRQQEASLAVLVEFAHSVAAQLATAAPVVEAMAKGGLGGVMGLLRNKS
jgi:hypothetical protein